MSVREETENQDLPPDSQEGNGATPSSFAGPHLDVAGWTDPGQVRPLNEDAWQVAGESETARFWEKRGRLLIVADGMGGHAAGEIASQLAVETLYQHYYDEDDLPLPPAIRLERGVNEANDSVYGQAVSVDAQSGMGTTLVAAVIHENRALIANVGDSRAYLIRDGQATQITTDHSWVAEQVKMGTITQEQAETHAYRNLVTRCLGHRPGMQVDIFEHRLRAGDTLLLCSDGLSNQVSDSELAAVLSEQEPEQAVQTLIDMANGRGGPDNITAVVARVLELPAWLTDVESVMQRPERLAAKTTQPVRIENEQLQTAAAQEAERADAIERGDAPSATFGPRRTEGPGRPRLSPRRRATLLLAIIALIALLAVVTLIALRADKITRWLAWPTPVSQLRPAALYAWGQRAAPRLISTHALQALGWVYAGAP
jgi:serine/threonine protein phosphatase PrpC